MRAYNDGMRWFLALAAWLLCMASPAMAAVVYKCVDSQGRVSYQDKPCPAQSRQTRMDVTSIPTVTAPHTEPEVAAPPASPTPPPASPAPRMVTVPPPELYRCTKATDGDTYLSRTGVTRPYLVPEGMLGWNRPLAEVYGSRQGVGVGMSAPELMPDPTPRMIGGHYYVRVRDICRLLPPHAACAALRKQYDANEEAIDRAFKSDRAPLREKRRQLRTQLAGCTD